MRRCRHASLIPSFRYINMPHRVHMDILNHQDLKSYLIGGSLSLHVQLALLGHVGHALVSGRKENWAMAGQSSQITDDVRPDEGRAGQCHCSDDCNGVNIFLAGNPSNHHEQTCACLQRRACYFCIRCQTSQGTKWSENCVKAKSKGL